MDGELHILISKGDEITVSYNGTTKVAPKRIGIMDLFELVKAQIPHSDISEFSTELPPNSINYKVTVEDGVETFHQVIIFREAEIRKISYYYDDFMVPIPPTLYKILTNRDGEVVSCHVCCVTVEPLFIQEDTPIYRFPYGGNVGRNICFGRNRLPALGSLRQAGSLAEIFLSSPFTESDRSMFEAMKNEKEFPLDYLEQMGEYGSFKE